MSDLKNLAMDDTIESDGDSLGSRYEVLDSNLYPVTIKMAYLMHSKGEALGLYLEAETSDQIVVTQTLWLTSGKAKGKKNYSVDKQGNKRYLPGFLQANALHTLITGKPLNKSKTQKKLVDVYDSAQKKRVPTEMEVVMELLGKQVILGLIKQKVNKNVLDVQKQKYMPSSTIREENIIDKFFAADTYQTITEYKAGSEATFIYKWKKKWAGKVKDRTVKITEEPVTAASTSATNPFATDTQPSESADANPFADTNDTADTENNLFQ